MKEAIFLTKELKKEIELLFNKKSINLNNKIIKINKKKIDLTNDGSIMIYHIKKLLYYIPSILLKNFLMRSIDDIVEIIKLKDDLGVDFSDDVDNDLFLSKRCISIKSLRDNYNIPDNRYIVLAIDLLEDKKIIIKTKNYSSEKFANEFSLNSKYLTVDFIKNHRKYVSIFRSIDDLIPLPKNINLVDKTTKNEFKDRLDKSLIDFIRLDYESSLNQLKDDYHKELEKDGSDKLKLDIKYNKLNLQLRSISEKIYYSTIADNSGRYYNSLTTLKKEYRKFLSFDNTDESFMTIDLINSQPYFLACLIGQMLKDSDFRSLIESKLNFSNFIKEYNLYIDLVCSGKLYEYIYKEGDSSYRNITIDGKLRNSIKKELFTNIYGRYSFGSFSKILPMIANFLNLYKKFRCENYKGLSIKLQSMEAELFINYLSNDLLDKKEKFFTIHDSISVVKSKINEVENKIVNFLFSKYGILPSLDFK